MHLEFDESKFIVSAGEMTIQLLPKEFALLEFMYRNKGLTFSREQLLDKVWPLEYPVERTVDDHIYRLRKKLHKLSGVELKTVRGFGYSLTLPFAAAAYPTLYDPELRDTMRDVFNKFHVYGQGKSILTLAAQRDTLGFELDPHYRMVIHFMQGDLEWLLDTEEVPLQDRLFSLVLFYLFSGDPKAKLVTCERMIEKKLLHPADQLELEILTILDLFILAGEPERALSQLTKSYEVIAELGYENFVPVTMITELFAHLAAGAGDEELNRLDEAIGQVLLDKPFLRETGSYKVVKGLWLMRSKQWREAEQLMDEGLQVLEMSGFVPLRLGSFYRIYHFCRLYLPYNVLQRKYESRFTAALEDCGLKRLERPLEEMLQQVLNPL
ncbi:winged helix-turn-helix domain-containing protein [Paenibacillus ihuae]|uniref:winged helix-turn-helix domain-containing protein n=1 Tax=Paenibacillus ihuae TaxID=1232431 RepID=UPI0006D55D8F|nr:winged helix-turn-helix domain-containing protein [Paenibacillus ihuae]